MPDCIKRSNLKLRPHQRKVVEYLQKNRGLIAAFGTGTGKTLTAVTAAHCFLDKNPKGRVIIVTPKSLQDNFKKEINRYLGKRITAPINKRFVFYTHQGFSNHFRDRECQANDMLIIDEAHNFRTHLNKVEHDQEAKIKKGKKVLPTKTQVALRCASIAKKILLLTATPVVNEPCDVENLVSMVKGKQAYYCPSCYGNSFCKNDEHKYSEFEEKIYSKIGGIRDHAVFNKYFDCTFSFYAVPDNENFPSLEEHEIEIPMTQEFYNEYYSRELNIGRGYKKKSKTFYLSIRTNSNTIEPRLKIEWIRENIVPKIKNGEKTIIYSTYIKDGLDVIMEMLDEEDIEYHTISGKVSMKNRTKYVEEFNDPDSGVDVFMLSKAGGEGLDLRGVRHIILYESGWNRGAEEQIIGRGKRFLSHSHLPLDQRNVNVYHLILRKPPVNPQISSSIQPRRRDQIISQERWKEIGGDKDVYRQRIPKKNDLDIGPSADHMLKNAYVKAKIGWNDKFLDELIPRDLENNKLCLVNNKQREEIYDKPDILEIIESASSSESDSTKEGVKIKSLELPTDLMRDIGRQIILSKDPTKFIKCLEKGLKKHAKLTGSYSGFEYFDIGDATNMTTFPADISLVVLGKGMTITEFHPPELGKKKGRKEKHYSKGGELIKIPNGLPVKFLFKQSIVLYFSKSSTVIGKKKITDYNDIETSDVKAMAKHFM